MRRTIVVALAFAAVVSSAPAMAESRSHASRASSGFSDASTSWFSERRDTVTELAAVLDRAARHRVSKERRHQPTRSLAETIDHVQWRLRVTQTLSTLFR